MLTLTKGAVKEMRERTVTQRNFAGAFLGGAAGILAFGLIHPFLLTPGCVLGVVFGWYYQEIWQCTAAECKKAMKLYIALLKERRMRKAKRANEKIGSRRRAYLNLEPILNIFRYTFRSVLWTLMQPIELIRWIREHPINGVYFVRGISVVISSALVIFGLFYWPDKLHWQSWHNVVTNNPSGADIGILMSQIILSVIQVATAIAHACCEGEEDLKKMRRFYGDWEYYSHCGAIRFFIKNFFELIAFQIEFFAKTAAILSWFLGIGTIFLVVVIMPMSAAIGAVKGIYGVATKRGHLLCLGVTLAVTILVAWAAHPYMNASYVVGLVALTAGILSAVATEMARRFIVMIFDRARGSLMPIVLTPLGEQLTPSGDMFVKASEFLDRRFTRLIWD